LEVGLSWQHHVDVDQGLLRPSDMATSRANPGLAADVLGWKAQIDVDQVIRELVKHETLSDA
jgi:GDPmannose 4,6-dehydratase